MRPAVTAARLAAARVDAAIPCSDAMSSGRAPWLAMASSARALLCYASHMAESPMEVILEVRYAWH